MVQQNHPTQELRPAPFLPTTSFVLASLAVLVATYLGIIRPQQEHLRSLERQCNKLVIAVKKLQGQDETARHGLRLIKLLETQNEKLASAEQAVHRFAQVREQMIAEANAMAEATTALEKLAAVRTDVNQHVQMLTTAANTLQRMASISEAISVSSNIALEVDTSLAALGNLQTNLTENVGQLSRQMSDLEIKLANRGESLPQAEQTLDQIDRLCDQLAREAKNLSAAQFQLGQLAGLKQEVLEHANNLPAAEAALDSVWDLHAGMLQARSTLEKAKKLAVDMMLLEPVIDQVTKSLQPAAEATRLSRRAAAKAPKTRELATNKQLASPWANAINVFVALLTPAG